MIEDFLGSFKFDNQFYFTNRVAYELYNVRYSLSDGILPEKESQFSLQKMQEFGLHEINISPTNPQSYVDYARPFYLEGRYKIALSILEKGYALSPYNLAINQIILSVAEASGDKQIIKKTLERAMKNVPGFLIFRVFNMTGF